MEPNHDRTPAATSNHKNDVRFLEDSLIKTPDPQACSTVNRQRDLNVSPVQEINSNPIETADERNFLVDERNTIGELHQKINQMFDVFKRESISSNLQSAFSEVNSSLGILKVDDLEDFNDADSSKVLESLLPKKVDDCEASWRMKRELARQSMSSQPSLGMEKPVNEFSFTNDWEAKGGVYNPFDGEKVSGQLCFDEQFDSGGSAKQRLLEDEANWMLTNADIPVANTDRSLSGIFTGDDAAVNISSASSYLRCGSGPIGTLGGGRDQALRPHFGTEIFSPVKELDNTGCMADVLPECSVNQSTADAGLDLSVSSIASVTQIKEMLCEMGQNSPTLIINKLMNAEGRKKAKQTNRMDALKKTASAYKRKENISIIDLTDDEKKAGSDRPNQTNEIIDLSSTIDNFQQMKPFASPQRGVLQDMTNLPRSPIKIVDLETNATIMDSSILKRDVESGKGVAGLRSAAANNEREMNFSNLEISSDSFVVGPLSRSTSIEDIGKAINASSCNSSMIDGADDNIKLRYCIGSICTVMVTLSNSSLTNDVHCSISLIEVLKDKQLCPKAVKAVFPDDVKLSPGESKRVEVQLIPFAIGLLDIALQVDEVEESSEAVRSFICTVTMKSEKPRLIISKVSDSADYLDNSQIDFGLLPEESLRKSVVSIENVGHVKVPINITVCHNTSKLQVFHLQEDDKSEVVEKLVILDPGERLEEAVYCFTPALEHSNTTKTKYNITGELCVSLASVVRETLKFGRFNLSATVGYTRLLISPSCNPLQVPAFDRRPLLIRNASVLPLTLNLLLDANEFALECDVIRLDANQDATIMVEFSPLHFKNNLERAGRLWLSIDSTETRYQVDLIGQCTVNHDLITSSTSTGERSMARPKSVDSVMSSASKATTPCTSRSSSPCSSNLSSEKGSLDLASTHSALVWASCPLQIAERKGCVLRNKNNYREKLLLTIVDNSGCFKLVEEKGNPVQEMRINLEGIESRQVTVSYCPLQVGACKASLVITRANQKSVCGQPNRKVLHLYGYGGKAVLNIRGVNKDPESKMWMYLDPDEIRAQFTLENSGDGTAFVRISQDMADTGVMITPQEALIAAHKKITVDLSFSPTTGRADHLLAKSEDSDVLVVTRLKIMFGDEATRLRLKRLYRKMINDRMGMDSLLMERLSVLDNLFPGSSSTEISCLKDTQASMKTLWVEGIREASVGVMLEKSALENAQLDATAQFIDLATTVTDDTVYVPKQQLIVAPRVVNLSWTQPSASFTLRNTTVLPIRVKMECPAGLTVDPAGPHTLDSHSSCAVTVTRRSHSADNMAATAASSLLRIYSDCTDPIEVPVNWNKVF